MDIKFKEFDYKTSLNQQRKLFIECFPENIGTPVERNDHYHWKFCSGPSKTTSFEYIACINNDIVGYYAAIPYKYSINGKSFTAGMVCDVMTGVTARGKGVFTKLGNYSINEFSKNNIDFTTGYPIRPEVIPGHKKVGWEFPFELPMYGKFISFKSFSKSRKFSNLAFIVNFFLAVWNRLISLFTYKNADINIEIYNQLEIESISGLEEFFTTLNKEIPIYLQKDSSFLKWRLGAPEKEYSIIALRDNTKIIAYSIARLAEKENVPCLGILDFVTLKGFEKYSSMLLQENEKLAYNLKAELILMMISKGWAKRFRFFKNGYLRTPYKFSFIINKLNQALNSRDLYNEKNWHLMWIDSDDL